MSEQWTVSYDADDGQRVVLRLGTPGPGRTHEEQAEAACDEIRLLASEGKASNSLVEVTRETRRFVVQVTDVRGRQTSQEFGTIAEARSHAETERRQPWIADATVRQTPLVRTQRRRILDATGRAI